MWGREITRNYLRNQNIIKKEGPSCRLQFLSARNVLVSFDLSTYLAQQYSIRELQPTSCQCCHHSPSSLLINEVASFPLTTKRCFGPLVIVVSRDPVLAMRHSRITKSIRLRKQTEANRSHKLQAPNRFEKNNPLMDFFNKCVEIRGIWSQRSGYV